ncbi:hypothetical protein C9374_009260 [Naegleria lovaniensis]|uniref:Uncharacterized protein n=1 Tax=Naegleria lovaniensis TaxID=51637 RepID=A0AA88GDD1_NAELO|nr:uncharacterized protein C9374_009260 [Naegleria lovaniensis]KAG2377349.1 hypothetical protein C9374_009260 [Naegleria lovaniensis]
MMQTLEHRNDHYNNSENQHDPDGFTTSSLHKDMERSQDPTPQHWAMMKSSSPTSSSCWNGFYEVLLHCLQSLRRMMFVLISHNENNATLIPIVDPHSPKSPPTSPRNEQMIIDPFPPTVVDDTAVSKISSSDSYIDDKNLKARENNSVPPILNSPSQTVVFHTDSVDSEGGLQTHPSIDDNNSSLSSNASLASASCASSSFSSCEDLHTFLEYGRRQSLFEPGEYVSVMTEILDSEQCKRKKQAQLHFDGLQLQ